MGEGEREGCGEADRARGVIAASAGNHAQGLALAAHHLGVKATIVMPRTTPAIKVNGVRSHHARVILHGDTYDEASEHARRLVEEKGLIYVHPYDDPDVIAGQGTIGMEILRQYPDPIEAIFVPVGGGGLLAGVAAYVKYVRPEIKLIGVEPEDAACLARALETGAPGHPAGGGPLRRWGRRRANRQGNIPAHTQDGRSGHHCRHG